MLIQRRKKWGKFESVKVAQQYSFLIIDNDILRTADFHYTNRTLRVGCFRLDNPYLLSINLELKRRTREHNVSGLYRLWVRVPGWPTKRLLIVFRMRR